MPSILPPLIENEPIKSVLIRKVGEESSLRSILLVKFIRLRQTSLVSILPPKNLLLISLSRLIKEFNTLPAGINGIVSK
jgi:hypothetical protein